MCIGSVHWMWGALTPLMPSTPPGPPPPARPVPPRNTWLRHATETHRTHQWEIDRLVDGVGDGECPAHTPRFPFRLCINGTVWRFGLIIPFFLFAFLFLFPFSHPPYTNYSPTYSSLPPCLSILLPSFPIPPTNYIPTYSSPPPRLSILLPSLYIPPTNYLPTLYLHNSLFLLTFFLSSFSTFSVLLHFPYFHFTFISSTPLSILPLYCPFFLLSFLHTFLLFFHIFSFFPFLPELFSLYLNSLVSLFLKCSYKKNYIIWLWGMLGGGGGVKNTWNWCYSD